MKGAANMHYHKNARTNIAQRKAIKENNSKNNKELAAHYLVSPNTISKWKNSDRIQDHSSRPDTIHYALSKDEERLIIKVRDHGLLLDELLEALAPYIERLNKSNCYRTLLRYNRNRLTQPEKTERKKFAQYEPGFLHVDVFYLPKIGPKGKKKYYYCFLAIDRATRLLLLEVYSRKGSREAGDFLVKCLQYFPFKIQYVLTDNGSEFTLQGSKNRYGKITKKSLFEIICQIAGIDHRKTKVKHPWTNGLAERMVRTVKEQTIRVTRYQDISELITDIKKFQNYHNTKRKLKVLKNMTCCDRIISWYQLKPELFMIEPSAFLTTTW